VGQMAEAYIELAAAPASGDAPHMPFPSHLRRSTKNLSKARPHGACAASLILLHAQQRSFTSCLRSLWAARPAWSPTLRASDHPCVRPLPDKCRW
jgi:hypothetical protein